MPAPPATLGPVQVPHPLRQAPRLDAPPATSGTWPTTHDVPARPARPLRQAPRRLPPRPDAPPSAPRPDAPAQPGRPGASCSAQRAQPGRSGASRPVRALGLAQRARMLVKNSSRLFGKQWTFCSSLAFDICFTCANVCQYLWILPDAWRLTTLIAGGRVLVRVLMTCVFLCESAEHTGRRCDKRFLISV